MFTSIQRKFNKRYDTVEEDNHRRQIFEDNANRVNLHNADFSAGLVTFDLDINKYSDLTQEEFVRTYTGIRRQARSAVKQPSRDYLPSYEGFSGKQGSHLGSGFQSTSAEISGVGNFGPAPDFDVRSSAGNGFRASSGFQSAQSGSSLSSSAAATAQGQNMMNVFMPSPMLESEVKDEVDWRKEGAVTPVKNQGNLGDFNWNFKLIHTFIIPVICNLFLYILFKGKCARWVDLKLKKYLKKIFKF